MRASCGKCGRRFTGLTAFDRHWQGVPMKAGAPCRHPVEVGLVAKRFNPILWGFPGTWAPPQAEEAVP